MMGEYVRAEPCVSADGRHLLVEAAAPFYEVCEFCGQRFALVSEGVLEELGIEVREREIQVVSKN